jgi:hypothetical protein
VRGQHVRTRTPLPGYQSGLRPTVDLVGGGEHLGLFGVVSQAVLVGVRMWSSLRPVGPLGISVGIGRSRLSAGLPAHDGGAFGAACVSEFLALYVGAARPALVAGARFVRTGGQVSGKLSGERAADDAGGDVVDTGA